MEIKMKCMQKLGLEGCKNSGTHCCADCKTRELFCFSHSSIHKMETQHRIFKNYGSEDFIAKQQSDDENPNIRIEGLTRAQII